MLLPFQGVIFVFAYLPRVLPYHLYTTFCSFVPRSGTSMRNPMQAVKRRSLGCKTVLYQTTFPKGGLNYPSRPVGCLSPPLGELCIVLMICIVPQLRRFTACSGFRMEVPPCGTHNSVDTLSPINTTYPQMRWHYIAACQRITELSTGYQHLWITPHGRHRKRTQKRIGSIT